MKVLLIHNFYSSSTPSGENQVFESERILLQQHGNEVQSFIRHSDELQVNRFWGKIKGALSTPWNPTSSRAGRDAFEAFKPDIVHVHNTFPLISPSIFYGFNNRAIKVLTLHNYRLFCPAAIPMRDEKVCTECMDARSPMPAVHHGCYRNSRAATLPLAVSVALHRALRTWENHVDAFIVLSEFQREIMAEAGLPRCKVYVKPNFYAGNPTVIPWAKRQPYVVFVGRLSKEKGVVNLLRAWQAWGVDAPELRLVGDGELRSELQRMAAGLPVRFLGQVEPERAHAEIANASLLILPSEWFETFGLVVVEAFAHGTPVAVSNIGALPSIVRDGYSGIVFEPANPQSLLNQVRTAWCSPGLLEKLGREGRSEFERKYTRSANYAMLMDIYQKAIGAASDG